ncbi:hypothetical protein DL771_010637 [Monosporascus sp. 5C6A]|nr:hypothetical protein DL771_010637 [Monosporascus sp. 5C6A]
MLWWALRKSAATQPAQQKSPVADAPGHGVRAVIGFGCAIMLMLADKNRKKKLALEIRGSEEDDSRIQGQTDTSKRKEGPSSGSSKDNVIEVPGPAPTGQFCTQACLLAFKEG